MPWQAAWGMTDAKGKLKVAFPPTAYYEMVNDPQTAAQIKQVGGSAAGGCRQLQPVALHLERRQRVCFLGRMNIPASQVHAPLACRWRAARGGTAAASKPAL